MKIFVSLLFAVALVAAPPNITELQPRGAQKGRPFELTIVGKDLDQGPRIVSSLPATFTALAAVKPGTATFLVEPTAEWAVGTYTIRVEAPNGISNILLFTVGAFPELVEEESRPGALPHQNDSIESAQTLPGSTVTVNGRLMGPERDVYRIPVKAGERRVFEVEARRAGSAIDPVIQLFDASGKRIARSEDDPMLQLDARIEMTFAKEGVVYAEVTDARFSTQMQDYYRFKTGSYSYASDVFPLGGKRGESITATIGKAQVPVDLKTRLNQVTTNLPDAVALPLPFAVGDFPEVREPLTAPLQLPVTINGRLEQPAEVDSYELAVKPGDPLLVELEARELGTSKLTGLLTIYDAAGKRLASAGDGPLPVDVSAVQVSSRTLGDPILLYRIPEGVTKVRIAVEDLARRGGQHYGYRLKLRQAAFEVKALVITPYVNIPAGGTAVVAVDVERRGFGGAVKVTPVGLPEGVTVAGGELSAEVPDPLLPSFFRRALISLTAKADAKVPVTDIGFRVQGEGVDCMASGFAYLTGVNGATQQGVVDRQRALNGKALGYSLPTALAAALPASLELSLVERVKKAEGFEFRFRWRFAADNKMLAVPETVGIDLPNLAGTRIIEMEVDAKDKRTGTFLVTTSKNSLPGAYFIGVNGRLAGGIDVASPVLRMELPELMIEEGKSNATNPAAR